MSGRPMGNIGDGPNSPSIDRIDSTKGYTEDNVQWVIWVVNDAKSNMSMDDFLGLCKDIALLN